MVNRRISRDLKERAVALTTIGHHPVAVADILGVSGDSVKRWGRNLAAHGVVQRKSPLHGRKRILSTRILEDIQDLLRSSPALYLDEIARWVAITYGQQVSVKTIHRSLKDLGYSVKRLRKTAAQRDELTRAQWKADILSRFRADQLVFADESSKDNRTSERRYGRAPLGERASEVLSFRRGIRYSILPALSVDGILTVRVVRGSVDGSAFYDWVISELLPKMNPYPGPNSVLIVDNCRTHKSNAVRDAVEAAGSEGCLYIFLPPYSPDWNPIEEAFSCLKYHLRRDQPDWEDTGRAPEIVLMEACMTAVTPEKARGWYAHSGYLTR
ncbi:hypothetical protein ONZ51_g11397 [Trametes cubensis]|uniref:Transposase n=1 Tax=Trametes cubensis TaxID=1111947 RepID=A0AAD7THQ5_9APHY|nr:hypothetical protein ONZ51_g11397 [Trametes cubensis]